MSRPTTLQDGQHSAPSERTPLLPSAPPTTVDTPAEASLVDGQTSDTHIDKSDSSDNKDDDGHTTANQTLTLMRGALCTIALGLLVFLQATNISMITVIQSTIASDLDAFELTTWFTSAYLIAMSALGPLNGKLATLFGPRICIFASTLILGAGCVVSGVSNTFIVFITGRCLTGVGASGIFTISIIVVLELTGSRRRGLAIGLLNSGYTFGVAIGATAAGALIPHVGWRALFWMQAPVALTGGTILLLAIPHDFTAGKKANSDADSTSTLRRLARLDYFGALTLTASIVLLLAALSSTRNIPIFPLMLSAVVLVTFIINEVYLAHDPIVPVTLLKSRGLLLTCLGTVGFMMARWSVLFYTPTYALAVRHWSPTQAGSILIPTNGGFAIGGLLVGILHIKRLGSFWVPTIIVYALFPLTLVSLSMLSTHSSPAWAYIATVFACGAVTGAALNYNLAHLLHLTPRSTHYIATSLVATFRGFAGSFGSAIGGGLFQRTLYRSLETGFDREGLTHMEELVRRLLGSPALVSKLDGVEYEIAVSGYESAVRILFLAGAGLSALMVLVQAGTGWTAAKEEEQERVVFERTRRDSDVDDEGE